MLNLFLRAAAHMCPILLLTIVATLPTHAGVVHLDPEFLQPGGGVISLPSRLSASNDLVRLRFTLPDYTSVVSLNSALVRVFIYDTDAGFESADLLLAQPGANLYLRSFDSSNLAGSSAADPERIRWDFEPAQLPNLLSEIQHDGTFVIRLKRTSGDFYLADANARLDLTYTPEPGSFALLGAGLAAGAVVRLRRKPRRG